MTKYKIKYQEQGLIKSKIVTQDELNNEDYSKNILEIKEIKSFNFNLNKRVKIDLKTLNQLFYELNLMLKANINIGDALAILIKNRKDKNVVEFLTTINYALSNSKPIIKELENFDIDKNIKYFLQISQDSSNISLNIESIFILLDESLKLKKRVFDALSYPFFLLVSFIVSVFVIFSFVVPNFKAIFLQTNNSLPLATRLLLDFEYFFQNYFLYLLIFAVFLLFLFIYFYKSSEKLSFLLDKIFISKVPIFSQIYKNFELYKLFLVIDIMQKSKYEFHKSFQTSKILLKNKYILDKIHDIDKLLENGKSISYSFSKSQIFDDIVLNLINTAEVSNMLEMTVCEIKKIYKNRFDSSVNLIILSIQPIFLLLIASLILFIVFAIFMPIWDIGSMIK